jgi:adenine/guanine phosphoribosyltransferase-like PRPP-binding protein
MPYPGTTFGRHNKKLSAAAARKAGKIATAMEQRGVPIGEAIATANKRGNAMMRKSKSSPSSRGKH